MKRHERNSAVVFKLVVFALSIGVIAKVIELFIFANRYSERISKNARE